MDRMFFKGVQNEQNEMCQRRTAVKEGPKWTEGRGPKG